MAENVTSSSESHYELLAVKEAIEIFGQQACLRFDALNSLLGQVRDNLNTNNAALVTALGAITEKLNPEANGGIADELKKIREIQDAARQASAALQAEASQYLQNQQTHAESYLNQVDQQDTFPLSGLPANTGVRDLPDGSRRFTLPDGTALDVRAGNPVRVYRDGATTELTVPASGSLTLPGGATVQIAPAFITESVTVAGLEGVPGNATVVQLGPGRYCVTLANGVKVFIFRAGDGQECEVRIENPTGGMLVLNHRGVHRFGLAATVRLQADGRLTFSTLPDNRPGVQQFAHSGVLDAQNGVMTLNISGTALVYRCADPQEADGTEPDTFSCEERGSCRL